MNDNFGKVIEMIKNLLAKLKVAEDPFGKVIEMIKNDPRRLRVWLKILSAR